MTELSPTFAKDAQQATGHEVSLRPDDMFYTRTDKRGVIVEANDVFCRISGYDWKEVRGAPHKIVRHPDMPRGLYHLYWERLKADKAIAAYVKNKTKDGSHYWVFAFVWPTEDGYTSVRIKPTSEMFRGIPQLYATLLEEERAGLDPEQSARRLVELLSDLGHRSYSSFMAHALASEVAARDRQGGRPENQVQRRFGEMFETVEKIGSETEELTGFIRAIRTVPMNMRILASRLENAGGPISAISVNYGSMLDEMSLWVQSFVDEDSGTYARIHEAVRRGWLFVCAISLQSDVARYVEEAGSGTGTGGVQQDLEKLKNEARDFADLAKQSLKTVDHEAARLSRSVLDMKRYVTGLSSTRMMCKIESAALHGAGDSSLSGIVDQLDAGQNEIEEKLASIVHLNAAIQSHTAMIRSMS